MSDDRLRREYAERLKQSYLQSGFKQGFEAGYAKAKEDFERLQWIPCSERLPEEGKSVLVWYEYYAYGNKNRIVQTYGVGRVYGDFWAGDVQGTRSKCIAWMPLPEPYNKEGEKE